MDKMELKKDENGEHIRCKYCGVNLTTQEEDICIWCVEQFELGKDWIEEEMKCV